MMTKYQEQTASFKLWLEECGEDNQSDIDKLNRMLPIAMKECCTEKQRLYITHFFADRMTMTDIAARYGVNKATVSRVIHTGLRKIYGRLKFCSPELCTVMQKPGRLSQGKAGRRKPEEVAHA